MSRRTIWTDGLDLMLTDPKTYTAPWVGQHDQFRAGGHYETHAALRVPSKCHRENFDYRLVQHCAGSNGGGSILRSAQ